MYGQDDFVTIYVHVADEHGTPKIQAQNDIWFEVEGEGELINRESIQANPFRAQFGTATALTVRSPDGAWLTFFEPPR